MTPGKPYVHRVRHPIPKSLPRLRRLLRNAGYHVRVTVGRDDGAPLTEVDRRNIAALLAGYGAGGPFDEFAEGTPKAGPFHVVKEK